MTLSIKECLRFGWNTFKKRPWILIGVLALGVIVEAVTSMLEEHTDPSGVVGIVALLVSLVISMLYALGQTHFFLKAHDNVAEVRFKDLWHPKPFLHFLSTSILLWLFIGLPYLALVFLNVPEVVLVLLIIPALVVSLVFGFAFYLVVDRDLHALEALKESARLTHGHRKQLFLLLLAVIGVNIVGLVALIIGLFISIPVTVLAMIHAYRVLSGAELPVVSAEA